MSAKYGRPASTARLASTPPEREMGEVILLRVSIVRSSRWMIVCHFAVPGVVALPVTLFLDLARRASLLSSISDRTFGVLDNRWSGSLPPPPPPPPLVMIPMLSPPHFAA